MNKTTPRHNVFVGLFVLTGVAILIAGVLLIGNLNKKFENKVRVVSFFDDVNGLQKGNYIWFSGVRIGTVKSVGFSRNNLVAVNMDIDKKVTQYVPKDSKVKLGSDAFIGNKILIIYGGTETAPKVKEGDTLKFEKTLSTEEMINTLQKNNENLRAITDNFKILSNKLVNGEGTIGKLLTSDSLYNNFNQAILSLRNASVKAQQITGSLAKLTEGLSKPGTLGNELANDTMVFKSVKSSLKRLQAIADTAGIFISNLKKAENNPSTPIGILLQDKESGTNLKETIKNLKSSSEKLDEDLKAMQHNFLLKGYFKKKAKEEKSDTAAK